MEPRDQIEDDERQRHESTTEGALTAGNRKPAAPPLVLGTADSGEPQRAEHHADWMNHASNTMIVETNRIREPDEAVNPQSVLIPIEFDPRSEGRTGAGNGAEKATDRAQNQSDNSRSEKDGDAGNDQADTRHDHDRDQAHTGNSPKKMLGKLVHEPSLTRTLFFSGLLSVVCGVLGAWVYWHFFGSSQSADQKTSAKNSESSKSSDASEKGSSDGRLRQVEAAWKAAVKELQETEAAQKATLKSEEETKAVLDFFKKTFLSAGRPGDSSLSQAFWAGGQGKDVTLGKAMDLAESRVPGAFAGQPRAEASVREMLGLGYLDVGEAAKAVKQYERAFALREAMQGTSHPETAACRNQLAVAYRIAGRTADASDLFERNLNSSADAAALAVRGSMLLLEKKPAEAELTLRSCLTIRQKNQPNDWSTFETESMLGAALLDQQKYRDAEPLLLSGYDGMKLRRDKIPAADKPRLARAIERLIKLYEAWGKPDKAIKWRTDLVTAEPLKSP